MGATTHNSPIPNVKRGQEFSVEPALLLSRVPPPPEDLNHEGVKWWNYYGGLMVEGHIFSRMFMTALHDLCILHMLRKHTQDALNKDGRIHIVNIKMIKEDSVETITINPLMQELRRILIDMDRLLASLGMTVPTSKAQQINTTGAGPNMAAKPPSPFNQQPSPEDGDLGFDIIAMEFPV